MLKMCHKMDFVWPVMAVCSSWGTRPLQLWNIAPPVHLPTKSSRCTTEESRQQTRNVPKPQGAYHREGRGHLNVFDVDRRFFSCLSCFRDRVLRNPSFQMGHNKKAVYHCHSFGFHVSAIQGSKRDRSQSQQDLPQVSLQSLCSDKTALLLRPVDLRCSNRSGWSRSGVERDHHWKIRL